MKTENWDVITDEDRCIILKHLHDQYDAMCVLCGKDSEEALDRVDSFNCKLSKVWHWRCPCECCSKSIWLSRYLG